MLVQTYVPQEPLSSFVDYFWYLHGYNPSHKKELSIPDGSTELIIDLREDAIRLFDKHNTPLTFGSSIICGPHSEHFIIDTAYESTVIGIHFKSGGAARFLPIPLNELHNLHVSLDVLWGLRARDLRDELLYSPTIEQRFHILEKYLLNQNTLSWSTDPAVKLALLKFQSLPHVEFVSDIIGQIGMSSKSFIQLFKEEVGLTPKRFCRLMRFQDVLFSFGKGKQMEWADIAAACGYYDQAHLIKEFRAFSGLTPTEYCPVEGRHPNHVRLS